MKVKVKEAYKEDCGKGIVRIDLNLEKNLNFKIDDIIKISCQKNSKTTAALLKKAKPVDKGSNIIRIDVFLRRNLNVSIDDYVEVSKTNAEQAKEVIFICKNPNITIKNPNQLVNKLESIILTKGDVLSFKHNDKIIGLVVSNYKPQSEAVIVHKNTSIIFQDMES